MRLAENLAALRALVQAMSAWLVKTRRALSRHGRDARVCGHTTTAMHILSTPSPHCLSLPDWRLSDKGTDDVPPREHRAFAGHRH